MIIDTHCHLTFPQFNDDRATVITNAKKAGIKKFIVPGVDTSSSGLAVTLAHEHPDVIFASVGIHPYEAQHHPDVESLHHLLKQKNNNRQQSIVAIGECGLDYHLYKDEKAEGKKDVQKRLFETQLELALQYDLPAIIHCRNGTAAFDGGAFEDLFAILDGLPKMPQAVIHCFSGGLFELRECLKRKLFIGIDGNITYSKQLALIAPQFPIKSLLLETDAPYLTPVPHRGERNEPKYISFTAKTLAGLLGIEVLQVTEQTSQNAQKLFRIYPRNSGL